MLGWELNQGHCTQASALLNSSTIFLAPQALFIFLSLAVASLLSSSPSSFDVKTKAGRMLRWLSPYSVISDLVSWHSNLTFHFPGNFIIFSGLFSLFSVIQHTTLNEEMSLAKRAQCFNNFLSEKEVRKKQYEYRKPLAHHCVYMPHSRNCMKTVL